MFCPQAIEWGTASEVLAVVLSAITAVATVAAVWIAMSANRKALDLARELRRDERDEAAEVRAVSAQAYAAVVCDELEKGMGHYRRAWRNFSDAQTQQDAGLHKAFVIAGIRELIDCKSEVLVSILPHVECFPLGLAKLLARTIVRFKQSEQGAHRNLERLDRPGLLTPANLAREYASSVRARQIDLARQIQLFYELAGFSADARRIPPPTEDELREIEVETRGNAERQP